MQETDPRNNPDLLETLAELCRVHSIDVPAVARAIGMQPGTFSRSYTGNPTVMLMKRVAWSLGTKWMWLALPASDVENWVKAGAILLDHEAPAFGSWAWAQEHRKGKKSTAKRSLGVDVTDKAVLKTQYPPKAIQGEVMDTNYIDFDHPLVPKHINPGLWEQTREQLGEGLPEHLVMTDQAVEARFDYKQYEKQGWTLENLADQGLICEKGQEG